MSDYNSALPVRTETAGDVISKICDATLTGQQLKVNANGSIDVNATIPGTVSVTQGTSPWVVDGSGFTQPVSVAGSVAVTGPLTDTQLRATPVPVSGTVTVTATNLDIRDLVFATDKVDVSGSTIELGATSLAALESITVQNPAGAGAVNIQDGGNSITVDGTFWQAIQPVSATDLDIRDLSHAQDSIKIGDGTDFVAVNADGSINVVASLSNDIPGDEICDYQTSSALAANASINFDYTVTAAMTMIIEAVHASGSGKIKVELKKETAAGSGTYNTKMVGFNSTACPDVQLDIRRYLKQITGAKVRVTITNRDNQPQDVYSTLTGSES